MIHPERVARDLFGLDGTATPLPGEQDLNFALQAGTTRYVLKLHAGAPDLALEDAVLEHLREEPAVPRLAGPRRRRQRAHGAAAELARRASRGRERAGDRASLGARWSRAWTARSRTSPTRDMHRPHRWDLKHGLRHRARRTTLPHQVIHNDANEYNVLVGRAAR